MSKQREKGKKEKKREEEKTFEICIT